MDGFAVASTLRQQPQTAAARLIAVTACEQKKTVTARSRPASAST
jgi:CheY-like chemotaxis protein